jgi:hypothetical protein
MSSSTSTADRTALAAMIAPEDLRCGDYVAVLDEIVELPWWLWCDAADEVDGPHRVRCRASEGGVPLKVKSICLPFVLVKSADKQSRTLDVRQYQLVRLDRQYARMAWKHLRRNQDANSTGAQGGDARSV